MENNMREFVKPNIVISKCLGFEACRYNGQIINDEYVSKLAKYVNYIPVCPECEIGLGIPRFPIRIVKEKDKLKLVQPKTGKDCTDDMVRFSETFLKGLKNIDGFILKFRSPSCGINDVSIYPPSEKASPVGKGPGFFGNKVMEMFPGLSIEHEGRLKNFKLREHTLTKLFALASFRGHKKKMSDLVKFHSNNKYLFMAYNQNNMRMMGKIVANHEKLKLEEVMEKYESVMKETLSNPPKRTSNINSIMHIFGYFKNDLSKEEKAFFLETLDLYREGRIPFTSAMRLLRSWTLRFKSEYLEYQTYFEPYPEELMELSDSGKKLDL